MADGVNFLKTGGTLECGGCRACGRLPEGRAACRRFLWGLGYRLAEGSLSGESPRASHPLSEAIAEPPQP